MIKNKQDKDDVWERAHVKRVLDCHNKKYETHITIEGKTQNVRLDLKGKSDWDWVCRDTQTNEEIAIEIKRLTDEKLEGRQNMLWRLLVEVRDSLLGKLPGTFVLGVDIPTNYHLPLKGHHNKQQFKKVLYEAIVQTAQTLKLGKDRGLTPQISGQLPSALPESLFCALVKVGDEDSELRLSSAVGGFWSPRLNEDELKKFEKLYETT